MKKNLFFLFLLISFSLFSFVNAQQAIPLTVAPARQELLLEPGEKQTLVVKFINQGSTPVSGNIRVADFVVDNTDGIPKILEDYTQSSPKYSASTWISSSVEKATLVPKDYVQLQFNLQVPQNARPGGRYVAIYFEPEGFVPEEKGSTKEAGSGVSTRIVSLLYLRVAGDITENAIISRFFAYPFNEYGPINVETDILNRGDYHIRPKGVIALSNVFDNVVAQQILKEENIFPDNIRSFKNEVGKKWMLGRYKLTLTAAYGDKGQSITRALFIWVIPWKIILIIIFSIILLSFLISSRKNRSKKKEERLTQALEFEKEEIEKLKKQLKNRSD